MNMEAPNLQRTTNLAFAGMMNVPALDMKPDKPKKPGRIREKSYSKVNLREVTKEKSLEDGTKATYKSGNGKIVIEKLEMKVENIKEFSDFMKLIKGLEDEVESNDDDGDDE
jgi:hypothetical protein